MSGSSKCSDISRSLISVPRRLDGFRPESYGTIVSVQPAPLIVSFHGQSSVLLQRRHPSGFH